MSSQYVKLPVAGGGGGGSGTVTSVGLSAPSILSVSGSPVTTSGTLALSLATQVANRVFAGPASGADATPAFRALVADDVPTLNQNTTGTASNITASSNTSLTSLANLATVGTITSGTWNATTIAVANGGTGQTTYTDGQLLIGNSSGNTLSKATITAGAGITITNGNGSVTVSNSGVAAVNTQASGYTLVLADAGKAVDITSATPVNVTVPLNSSVAFAVGTQVLVTQLGAGAVTIAATGGVTIRTPTTLILAEQYASASLRKIGTDEWIIAGYLQP